MSNSQAASALSPRERAERLLADGPPERDAFIGGRAVQGDSRIARNSPIDGREVSRQAACAAEHADAAVAAARKAFEDGGWSMAPPELRQQALGKLAQLIEQEADDLAVAESLENGMPLGMCRNRNIPEAAECLRWYGDAIGKASDESLWLDAQRHATVERVPTGVAAIIVPWNFPMMIAAWKIAPALAAGCTVVLKPSELTPSTACRIGALAKQAGLPDGVLNVVTGTGEAVGATLAAHEDVDAIAFTGSTATGKSIMAAATGNLKRVWLECGGKTAVIIAPDCSDFADAVRQSAVAFFRHQGQICNAGSRLLVPAERAAEAAELCAGVARSLKIGDPLDPATDFGPVIDASAAEHIIAAANRAVEQGAELVCGGKLALASSGGSYVEPTVLSAVSHSMEIARKEVFGPALAIMPYDGIDEAVAIANGTDYGLGACLFTSDLSAAHLIARRLRAGHVLVNQAAGASLRLPFGGFKQSGFGRDKSVHAMDKFTELKATTYRL